MYHLSKVKIQQEQSFAENIGTRPKEILSTKKNDWRRALQRILQEGRKMVSQHKKRHGRQKGRFKERKEV